MNEGIRKESPTGALSAAGFIVALLAAILSVVSGLGNRLGVWNFMRGFAILRYAVSGAAIGVLISFFGLISSVRGGRLGLPLAGIIIGLVTMYVPLHYLYLARTVPPIHDISTDTDNPPKFVALQPLRGQGPYTNPPEYGGPVIAALQHKAYPDILPLVQPVKSDIAFERALAAARKLNWTIIDANEGEGRIEATDTTRWFGFTDDIVIRISSAGPESSRVDIRSESRVGRSDLGKNAERIRKFLAVLKGII